MQAWHRSIQSVQLMKRNTHCVHCTNCMLLLRACTSVCLGLPPMSKREGTPYEHTTCATPIYQCSVHCANCMLNWRACTLVIPSPCTCQQRITLWGQPKNEANFMSTFAGRSSPACEPRPSCQILKFVTIESLVR